MVNQFAKRHRLLCVFVAHWSPVGVEVLLADDIYIHDGSNEFECVNCFAFISTQNGVQTLFHYRAPPREATRRWEILIRGILLLWNSQLWFFFFFFFFLCVLGEANDEDERKVKRHERSSPGSARRSIRNRSEWANENKEIEAAAVPSLLLCAGCCCCCSVVFVFQSSIWLFRTSY